MSNNNNNNNNPAAKIDLKRHHEFRPSDVSSIFSRFGFGGQKASTTANSSPSSPPLEQKTHLDSSGHGNIRLTRSDGLNHDLLKYASRALAEKDANPVTAFAPSSCIIVHFSDTRNMLRQKMKRNMFPEGDILIHSGGFTSNGTIEEYQRFDRWLGTVKDLYKYRVVVPGLNDVKQCGNNLEYVKDNLKNATHVLCDSEETVLGLRIFGAAWHHHAHDRPLVNRLSATNIFQSSSSKMHVDDHNKFDEIPVGVDVLVTHGAAYGKLDFCDLRSCLPADSYASDAHNHTRRYSLGEIEPPVLQRKGSRELVKAIARIRPGLHLHGMALEARGVMYAHGEKDMLYPLTINSAMTDPRMEVLYTGPHVIECSLHNDKSYQEHPAFASLIERRDSNTAVGKKDNNNASTTTAALLAIPVTQTEMGEKGRGGSFTMGGGKGKSFAWEFEIASPFH